MAPAEHNRPQKTLCEDRGFQTDRLASSVPLRPCICSAQGHYWSKEFWSLYSHYTRREFPAPSCSLKMKQNYCVQCFMFYVHSLTLYESEVRIWLVCFRTGLTDSTHHLEILLEQILVEHLRTYHACANFTTPLKAGTITPIGQKTKQRLGEV